MSPDLDHRLTRVEHILPTLATKDDLRALAGRYALRIEALRDDIRLLAESVVSLRNDLHVIGESVIAVVRAVNEQEAVI
jgi:hypothetical protein